MSTPKNATLFATSLQKRGKKHVLKPPIRYGQGTIIYIYILYVYVYIYIHMYIYIWLYMYIYIIPMSCFRKRDSRSLGGTQRWTTACISYVIPWSGEFSMKSWRPAMKPPTGRWRWSMDFHGPHIMAKTNHIASYSNIPGLVICYIAIEHGDL